MTRKKVIALFTLFMLIVVAAVLALRTKAQSGASTLSRVAGVYNSQSYVDWGATIVTGNTATGSQTIVICPWYVALRDGRVFQPFASANAVFTPISVDRGASNETVTPTATAQVASPIGTPQVCANVTASFSNTHAASGAGGAFNVTTGDQGIQEAITDASLNNGGMVYWFIDPGIVTMNTGGATTTLGSINIPTRSVVMSATARVTTTIATCAGGWSLAWTGGSGTNLTAANTTLTAGTTTDSSTLATPVAFNISATTPVAFCTTSNASAGAIHATFAGYKLAAPAQ
jgi:hypothetical protein